ncbi:ABC transporter ATP-binding protein [uncultured Alsobacter sp.]|uniref:ABC transporter ATP-binding protein n=1 Tax=uncultured Alsobacter sp. TaxID=1748258 RepID=UPI0025D7BAFA|nr:ABC transporter ATP-binding protein [uncultured Alsobacter sp.]
MADAAAPLLDVRGLTVAVHGIPRVRDLSFSVASGETLALVGESGSGKSLTGLAIMRLLPRAARLAGGVLHFADPSGAGVDLATIDESALRTIRGGRIAMVFQEPMTSLNPVLTVGAQIGETLRIHAGLSAAAARRRAVELLDLVRVPDPSRQVDEYPHRLSGGMRQRVMIAMAVACNPALLIADEPTTALDVTIQAQVLELIDRLRRDLSMGVILITHDLGVVGQWADRVVVLYAGSKAEEARAETVFADPRHPYTQGLIGASPRAAGRGGWRAGPLPEIPGSIADAPAEGCAFAPRCPHVRPSCRAARPPAIAVGPAHLAACPVLNPVETAA